MQDRSEVPDDQLALLCAQAAARAMARGQNGLATALVEMAKVFDKRATAARQDKPEAGA